MSYDPSKSTIDNVYDTMMAYKTIYDQEQLAVAKVRYGEKWVGLQSKINDLTSEQLAMVDDACPTDHTEEYETAKKEFLSILQKEELTNFKKAFVKFKNKNKVDIKMVAGVLDGDLSLLFAIAHISLIDLKQHASGNSKYHELMGCVIGHKEMVDIVFEKSSL